MGLMMVIEARIMDLAKQTFFILKMGSHKNNKGGENLSGELFVIRIFIENQIIQKTHQLFMLIVNFYNPGGISCIVPFDGLKRLSHPSILISAANKIKEIVQWFSLLFLLMIIVWIFDGEMNRSLPEMALYA